MNIVQSSFTNITIEAGNPISLFNDGIDGVVFSYCTFTCLVDFQSPFSLDPRLTG